MLERTTTIPSTVADDAGALTRRRTLFTGLVAATMIAVLWLAMVAVPPYSAGAISFLVLFIIILPWSVIGFWNAFIGFLIMRFARDPAVTVNPLAASIRGNEPITTSTAILMCIRNESPDPVARNLQPLMEGLVEARVAHLFHVYVLSDSSDSEVIAAETALINSFTATWQGIIPVTYRRRAINTAFKSGNIRDFCERWGGNHDFAITLDADSFMPTDAVLRMIRIAQTNPTLGILQTLIIGMPSVSVFARMFQFGMRLGMRSYTLGATWWQGDCGPYWGHNAVIRLAPFIAHCHMPMLPGKGPLSGYMLSHDQIEAVMMRRAGFEVRVLPIEGMSWEENPPTLMEFSRRDLRWLQGNMQYWQLLGMPGLKPVSRFQLMFAIQMYLGSPAWMAMTAIGTLSLALSSAQSAQYIPIKLGAGSILFAIMMLMTFAPKIATMIDVMLTPSLRRAYGGALVFVANIVAETLFMTLLAPIIALSHTIFMTRLFVFRRGGSWTSQTRQSHAVPFRMALVNLWPQTLAGCTVLAVAATKAPNDIGFVLLGTTGLILAAPFAVATASPLIGRLFARIGICHLPEEKEVPAALAPLHLPAIEVNAPSARLQP
ncbi:MAG: glucans biosynthesis glucosyltransferase MdoH [Pseudolabrys sp.]